MTRAAVLAALLLLPAAAKAAPLDAFLAAFGEDGVKTLSERGYMVLQGSGADRRLAAVHWKALEGLAAAAGSCEALVKGESGVAACRALPDDGAVTPRLHALAATLTAADEERASLVAANSPLDEPAGLPNLFETAWGKDLDARLRADRLEDHGALAKGFFEDLLAGPRPNAVAAKHFLAVEAAAGVAGAEAALNADAARGAASDSLRAMIRRYLQDERRRRGLALARDRAAALAADKTVRKELDALGVLASALSRKPSPLEGLEAAVSGAPAPKGVPRLRSAGIHLQDPVRLGQYELGDRAFVSGAYWVDGLPEGKSVPVEETTFLETERGFSAVETRTVKRRNGGPYPYERRVEVTETRPFAVVGIFSAAVGTVIAERVEVPLADDYELSLKKEAAALQALQSCDPKSAEAAYAELESLIGDAATIKPQYASLLKRTRRGRASAVSDAALLAKLEEAVSESRADSSPQQCRYDLRRTDAAIKLERRLPPGCDRLLPELFTQRSLISRRATDQKWFLKASAEARSRRRSCDLAGAARRWNEALSVLEADPAANCGAAAEEVKTAESGMATARAADAWTESLTKTVDRAELEPVPAKRLELLAPALARLASLPDRDCRRALLKRAQRLADKAGAEEDGPGVASRLPADAGLAATTDEVRRARARLQQKADASYAPETAPAAAPVKIKPLKKTSAKRASNKKTKAPR